ncbi:hypothetical protein LMG28688_06491 [Paraburkholderia caffeinitolerans]|uniref:AAA+ ATPase domain-containing protein n=1 Tax=Paraburkholderia caffeinitolerans TaxID=1723730 RepID=A0A6J5GUH3_9BURK|nr:MULTISPECIES: MoxR family ATPase [Paraburkholderia]CAB3807139.1 hypothetical protein LMG28688_06491 [Paraburkholderia caffeinitolerans]
MQNSKPFMVFIGHGTREELRALPHAGPPWGGEIGPWRRRALDDGAGERLVQDHPEGYSANPELAEAVNTAIILGKPLLLTGRPGTGKSQLADRVAWEFNLSPVLRFEAQSMSEAQDLFYRYDLVAQLGAVEMLKAGAAVQNLKQGGTADLRPELPDTNPRRFITFGPLGEAILRASPRGNENLLDVAVPAQVSSAQPQPQPQPRPSVVLIDEIDKASRDFPNDLLNGIERLEFRIRELQDHTIVAPDDPGFRPIVIITSNSERDLPDAFLRRCIYYHIKDPDKDVLRKILLARVFPLNSGGPPAVERGQVYEDLLDFFVEYRDHHGEQMHYRSGTSELIDWARALKRDTELQPEGTLADNRRPLQRTLGSVAKHREDRKLLDDALANWGAAS